MNLAVYTTVDRLGLALAITLEFLGPLGVALFASRTRRDLVTAVATGGGVYVLVLPGPTSDLLGIGIGLFSACCWAGYILLNRLVGARLPGLQGTALATTISASGYLPVLAVLAASGRITPTAIGYAVAAGTLASVVPYTLDLIVLRHVPAQVFGIVMSAHPVLAAVAGMVILGQLLAWHEWAGIAVIVIANVATVRTAQTAQTAQTAVPTSAPIT
jgi:inner membrane transporter RhtA